LQRKIPLAILLGLLASCAGHPSRVTDLASTRVYYTKHIRRGLTTGNIYFKDAKTGAEVTLATSAIQEITEEEFAKAVGGPTAPAPPRGP